MPGGRAHYQLRANVQHNVRRQDREHPRPLAPLRPDPAVPRLRRVDHKARLQRLPRSGVVPRLPTRPSSDCAVLPDERLHPADPTIHTVQDVQVPAGYHLQEADRPRTRREHRRDHQPPQRGHLRPLHPPDHRREHRLVQAQLLPRRAPAHLWPSGRRRDPPDEPPKLLRNPQGRSRPRARLRDQQLDHAARAARPDGRGHAVPADRAAPTTRQVLGGHRGVPREDTDHEEAGKAAGEQDRDAAEGQPDLRARHLASY